MNDDLWHGLKPEARASLELRNYSSQAVLEQLRTTGVEWKTLAALDRTLPEVKEAWIAGVELILHEVYPQRHRGIFAEFGREGEGVFGKIGMWPRQWATARMNAGTSKGFHIHPPHLVAGADAEKHFQRLFVEEPSNCQLRPYELEQWDAMFFIQGKVEIFLVDERAGLPRRIMRFFVEGDNHRGPNNGGIIIPPGVAHAMRVEGSEDAIMVYGTSTRFNAQNEGRLVSGIETAALPADWVAYLQG